MTKCTKCKRTHHYKKCSQCGGHQYTIRDTIKLYLIFFATTVALSFTIFLIYLATKKPTLQGV